MIYLYSLLSGTKPSSKLSSSQNITSPVIVLYQLVTIGSRSLVLIDMQSRKKQIQLELDKKDDLWRGYTITYKAWLEVIVFKDTGTPGSSLDNTGPMLYNL